LPTPYDVSASQFIPRLAKHIKDRVDQVQPPPWALMVKTSTHTQRQPEDLDWWFTRAASILRKVYLQGPVGIERLRARYGGRKSLGVRRQHARKGGGSNVRKILQQLETAGLVEPTKGRGRVLTKEGRRVLDKIASEVKEELEKDLPELKKYP